MNNEDKQSWCHAGQLAEGDFLVSHTIKGWGLAFNPEKQTNKYVHDFIGLIPVDLKSIRQPWIKSQELFNIPSERAISINEKDFVRYAQEYPNILILCHVEWLDRCFILTLDRARKLIKEKRAIRHEYLNRKDDTSGNAKVSYIFDVDDLDQLHG